jgi:hypothetical protein
MIMRRFKRSSWLAVGVCALSLGVATADASADPCALGPLAFAPECALYGDLDAAHQQAFQQEADALGQLPVEAQDDLIPEDAASALSTGIFNTNEDVGQAPMPPGMFAPTNAWTGLNALTPTSVWAGASLDDPTIGMIVVATYDATGSYVQHVKAITAPGVTGALRITSSLLTGLSIVASNSRTFVFDFLVDKIVPTP